MAIGEYKAVAVGPFRVLGVVVHDLRREGGLERKEKARLKAMYRAPEYVCHRRAAHGGAGVAAVGLLDRVGGLMAE